MRNTEYTDRRTPMICHRTKFHLLRSDDSLTAITKPKNKYRCCRVLLYSTKEFPSQKLYLFRRAITTQNVSTLR